MTPPVSDAMLPASGRPKLTQREALALLAPFAIDRVASPIVVLAVRGYYRDTMGRPGVQERGIYDDAVCVDTPDAFRAFNANTDPGKYAPGIASLLPGCYYAHRLDLHDGRYLALCQRAAQVWVQRDGGGRTRGMFGINLHRGGETVTGSLGCLTIPPAQWTECITLLEAAARRAWGVAWQRRVIPLVLVDGPIR